jgi:hypothetical protein
MITRKSLMRLIRPGSPRPSCDRRIECKVESQTAYDDAVMKEYSSSHNMPDVRVGEAPEFVGILLAPHPREHDIAVPRQTASRGLANSGRSPWWTSRPCQHQRPQYPEGP